MYSEQISELRVFDGFDFQFRKPRAAICAQRACEVSPGVGSQSRNHEVDGARKRKANEDIADPASSIVRIEMNIDVLKPTAEADIKQIRRCTKS